MDRFCFKRNIKLKKVPFQAFMELAPALTLPLAH